MNRVSAYGVSRLSLPWQSMDAKGAVRESGKGTAIRRGGPGMFRHEAPNRLRPQLLAQPPQRKPRASQSASWPGICHRLWSAFFCPPGVRPRICLAHRTTERIDILCARDCCAVRRTSNMSTLCAMRGLSKRALPAPSHVDSKAGCIMRRGWWVWCLIRWYPLCFWRG